MVRGETVTVRSNLAVIVVTHDEPKLLGATRSIHDNRQHVTRVYLVDAGTTDRKARKKLGLAYAELRKAGIDVVPITMGHVGPTAARKEAYRHVLEASDIDLVTSLDADDRYGSGILAQMRTVYARRSGEVDLIVPRHILRVRDSDQRRETITLTVPEVPRREGPSDELVGAWVRLTWVGATFAASTEAIRRFGSFADSDTHDEWVVTYCRWAGLGARICYADIRPEDSYWYFHHDKGDHHQERRQDLTARRHEAAMRGFREAAARRNSSPPLRELHAWR